MMDEQTDQMWNKNNKI